MDIIAVIESGIQINLGYRLMLRDITIKINKIFVPYSFSPKPSKHSFKTELNQSK